MTAYVRKNGGVFNFWGEKYFFGGCGIVSVLGLGWLRKIRVKEFIKGVYWFGFYFLDRVGLCFGPGYQ